MNILKLTGVIAISLYPAPAGFFIPLNPRPGVFILSFLAAAFLPIFETDLNYQHGNRYQPYR